MRIALCLPILSALALSDTLPAVKELALVRGIGGIRRRAWGRGHLMRSGKRSQPSKSWRFGEGEDTEDGVESADLGIGLEPLRDNHLRRVYRSYQQPELEEDMEIMEIPEGDTEIMEIPEGDTMIQSKRSMVPRVRVQPAQLRWRSTAGLARRGGRRAWFGGGHMLRSGKKRSQGDIVE